MNAEVTDKRVSSSGLQRKTPGCVKLERAGTLVLALFKCRSRGDVSVHLAAGAFHESDTAAGVRRTIQRN